MPNPLSVTEEPKPSPLCIQYGRQHGPDSNQGSDYTRIKKSKRLGDPLNERVTVSVHKFNVIKLTFFFHPTAWKLLSYRVALFIFLSN